MMLLLMLIILPLLFSLFSSSLSLSLVLPCSASFGNIEYRITGPCQAQAYLSPLAEGQGESTLQAYCPAPLPVLTRFLSLIIRNFQPFFPFLIQAIINLLLTAFETYIILNPLILSSFQWRSFEFSRFLTVLQVRSFRSNCL